MSHAPVHRMRKDEIVKLGNSYCSHGHTYLEHFSCFLKEHPPKQKIGYFDIESSALVADFGFCIGWRILDTENNLYGRVITKEEVLNNTKIPDYNLMQELVDTLNTFDLLYTYYGTKFDFPFVRTRCVEGNIKFPNFGTIKHKDVYYIIRNKFRLHRSRLETACEMLLGHSNKTHWMGKHWIGAVQGKEESLKYIDEHCIYDVKDLKELTETVLDYANPNTTKSI
jgi:uncharacterized protein YprB with RNaseH-like and TPR domain